MIHSPLEFLLFSDFAVIVGYVHLFTLFMVVPIFNSMARIDRSLLEAARDAGAGRFRVVWEVVLPLSKTGIALGSIFVVTQVMGDFFVVKIMSGGQSTSVVSALYNRDLCNAISAGCRQRSAVVDHCDAYGRGHPPCGRRAQGTRYLRERTAMAQRDAGSRPWTFWFFAAFFVLFVIFLYGPMFVVYVLSFQGEDGGLTFPLQGVSTHWFHALTDPNARSGDIAGAFQRSIGLGVLVALLTVVLSVAAGLGFRRRFLGSALIFYIAIASLIMPGLFVGLGINVLFNELGWVTDWTTSGLGAQLTWTLPFGLLIMFAVLGRFNRTYEEAATDLGATAWQRMRDVTLPILLPGIIGVALFGFTLSYDEFPRTVLTSGSANTLPIEIWTMTTNVTSPALYAVGTVTTVISFLVIGAGLGSIALIQRRRRASAASPPDVPG